jgi:hypothetical protein
MPAQRKRAGFPPAFIIFLTAVALAGMIAPAFAGDSSASFPENTTSPQVVEVGVNVVDFKSFSIEQGTVQANFYLSLRSDAPISIDDIEFVNGHALAVDTLTDTPNRKYYRIIAGFTADPDLHRYPFDRHLLDIGIEPKTRDATRLLFVIDRNETGLDPGSDLPGWEYGTTSSSVGSHSYSTDELPYSRAMFTTAITRDTVSTILKFFLPVFLIVIVSLSSLVMKVSSRLGLNASMFLAAVLIHWRIADSIPLVAYATFLDIFMIITYATLVMVLVSGILVQRYAETKDTAKIDLIHHWSIRIIPAFSIVLYAILFIVYLG